MRRLKRSFTCTAASVLHRLLVKLLRLRERSQVLGPDVANRGPASSRFQRNTSGVGTPNLVLTHADKEEGVNLPEGLDLVPAARKLEGIDQAVMTKSKFVTPLEVLKVPLDSLRGRYDFIFLDTAPNATLPTLAAYMNADYFILSAMPDPFAIAGLNDALRDIMDARARGNPGLVLLGVVISGVDKRTSLANSLSEFVEKSFRAGENADSIKFKTTIGRSTVIPQTQKVGKTLFETHST